MRIERLTVENWLPFGGRQVLELPAGPIAVTARYVDNPRRSNWAGKTALLEAIEWCLFGVHRKRYEDDVIHSDEGETSVRLVLTGDVIVTRSRRRGKSTQTLVEIGGVGFKQKEAQTKINEVLGFTSDDYRATVCFTQGDTSAIVEKSSGERRKVVGQWLELEAWLRVTSRVRVQARSAAKAIAESRATLKALTSNLDDDGYLPEEEPVTGDPKKDRLDAIEKVEKAIEASRTVIEQSNNELEAISEMEIARLDRQRFNRLLAEAQTLRDEMKSMDPASIKHRLEVLGNEYPVHQTAAGVAKKVEQERGNLHRKGFKGICPVVGTTCPSIDFVESSKKDIARMYEESKTRAAEALERYEKAKLKFDAVKREDRLLADKRSSYKTLTAELKRLKASAETYEENDEPDEEYVTLLRRSLKEERETEREHMATLAKLQARQHRISSMEREVERVSETLDDLEHQARVAAVALRCVGPSGVPAKIAEASLAHLEERANALLEGSGLTFTFAWDRETKDLTPTCFECGYTYKGKKDKKCPACDAERGMKRADELEILVDDGSGELEDVKAKSGGAKVLVGSAIRLGAGLMLRELRGSPAAWAQVDEPFGPLDAENRATLAQTFAGMLGAVGLEQAFVVSHDSALLDALPSRIEIVREGNVSIAKVR